MKRFNEKKKRFIDPSGFTLVEIMIATGILAVAMLGIMQVGTQGNSSSKSNTVDLDFTILTSNLQMALNTDCTGLLANKSFVTTAPTPNPTLGPLALPLLSPTYTIAAIPSPLPSPLGMVVTSISLNQTPILMVTAQGGNLVEYQTNLNIQAKKVAPQGVKLLGTSFYSKDFPISVWVNTSLNPNVISNCQQGNPPSGATLTINSALCVGTNPTVSATWTSTNPNSVYSAGVVDTLGNPYPLTAGNGNPSTFVALPGSDTYTLLLTDSMGVQSYGATIPVTQTVTVPSCAAAGSGEAAFMCNCAPTATVPTCFLTNQSGLTCAAGSTWSCVSCPTNCIGSPAGNSCS